MAFRVKTAWNLLRETASEWSADKGPRLGASVAFYTLFSLSPLLVIVVAIAGLWFGPDAARNEVFNEIRGLVGDQGAAAIQSMILKAWRPDTGWWASIVAGVTLFIGATAVMVELQDALNTMWGVKANPHRGWWAFIRNRLLSFGMVLAIGFLLLVSLVVSAALSLFGKWLGGLAPGLEILWHTLNFAVSLGVMAVLFAMLFKFMPDVEISWHDVWIGALITSFLFAIGKFAVGLYLGRSSVASAYGTAGSLVVLLFWIYYSAQIVFFGAEFTQVYANHCGSKVCPAEYASFTPAGEEKRRAA